MVPSPTRTFLPIFAEAVAICMVLGCGGDKTAIYHDAGVDLGVGTDAVGADAVGADAVGAVDPERLYRALRLFGVDPTPTAQMTDDNKEIPSDHLALGSRLELGGTDELLLIGIRPFSPAGKYALDSRVTFLSAKDAAPSVTHLAGIFEPAWAKNQTPTSIGSAAPSQSKRAALGADVDGDGVLETAVVYATGGELRLDIIDDGEAAVPYGVTTTSLAAMADVRHLALAVFDGNGDGWQDLVIGVNTVAADQILFVDNKAGTLQINQAATKSVPRTLLGAATSFRISAGNIDLDGGSEVVVVLNESIEGNPPMGAATYRIFDNAKTGYADLGGGPIKANDITAVAGDVQLGDVDGDGLDEIMLAGLGDFLADCSPANMNQNNVYLGVVLDDNIRQRAVLAATNVASGYACGKPILRSVFARIADLDGDRKPELIINQQVFRSMVDSKTWSKINTIADFGVQASDAPAPLRQDSTTQMVTGDFTGDGFTDVALYLQSQNKVIIWGRDKAGALGRLTTLDVEPAPANTPQDAILVSTNVDADRDVLVPVLRPDGSASTLIWTAPIVHAVIAAAPCAKDIGQNVDACSTSFGTATSATRTVERVASFKIGVMAGVGAYGLGAKAEAKLKAEVTAKYTRVRTDTFTREVTFTAAPFEDAVVFTTVPYDVWEYEQVSSSTRLRPSKEGRRVTLYVPRQPQTLISEYQFYKTAIPVDFTSSIPTNVFSHMPGVLSSYPTQQEKSDLLAMYPGMENGPYRVGAGAGQLDLSLAIGEQYSNGFGYGFELSYEVEGGAGFIAGYSVAGGYEASFTFGYGVDTTYSGSVGSIATSSYADNQYSLGIFYYWRTRSNAPPFQVINYWVEP